MMPPHKLAIVPMSLFGGWKMKTSSGGVGIHIDNVNLDYVKILELLRDKGDKVSPRGMETRELIDVVFCLDPRAAIITDIGRKASMKLISMEALQLISCTSWPQRTIKAAPNMARFLDGEAFHGAYGVRIGAQLEAAVTRLKSDRFSRQAVITIWDPILDAFRSRQALDVPCTTMLQFLIREDKLILHVTMRSNDAWWGIPHDWGQFSQLQLAMAKVLDVTAGDYYHHVVSLHLYERDFDKIDTLHRSFVPSPIEHDGIGAQNGMTLEDMQLHALTLLDPNRESTSLSKDDEWHRKIQMSIDA
jgi:hypothetical protein